MARVILTGKGLHRATFEQGRNVMKTYSDSGVLESAADDNPIKTLDGF
jgi:hypothetical protein